MKLVCCLQGHVYDVAVDLRHNSPTLLQWHGEILRDDESRSLLIPEGFAHGFCTLEPNTELVYKVSRYYSPQHDLGLLWNDPSLGIAWPVGEGEAVLSDKDRRQPRLVELPHYFRY